ncbi:MAG: hypothetical protein ACUVWX_10085 [Kiritimatiellia bacterium]
MDIAKIRKLLHQIEKAQLRLTILEKKRAILEEQVKAQKDLIGRLKQELLSELGESPGALSHTGKQRSPKVLAGRGGRPTGLSDAILSVLADGNSHSVDELKATARGRGIDTKNIFIALTYLAKKGRIKRVGRALYAKA